MRLHLAFACLALSPALASASALTSAQNLSESLPAAQSAAFDGALPGSSVPAVTASASPIAPLTLSASPSLSSKRAARRGAIDGPVKPGEKLSTRKKLGLWAGGLAGLALLVWGIVLLASAPPVGIAIAASFIQTGGLILLANSLRYLPDSKD